MAIDAEVIDLRNSCARWTTASIIKS